MNLARLNFNEAREYADLIGIQHDLRTTIDYCDVILNKQQDRSPNEELVLEGLCHAAVIRYCRAFSPGARFHLDRKIFQELPSEYAEDHEFIKSLRDKYIAHSVNPFEECAIYAQIRTGENGKLEIPNVQSRYMWMRFLEPHEIQRLKGLAGKVLESVEDIAGPKQQTVIEIARKLHEDEIEFSSGTEKLVDVSREAVSKRRNGKK
ncbi:MAG: hypothetical protein KKF58_03925 [Gammaproteobacteria bacterium]|nr:hypothetical protein [Gammaproteobacteria bacterium]MBU1447438.1 hypothetical protein [Gammaproteobacteria bacterium]